MPEKVFNLSRFFLGAIAVFGSAFLLFDNVAFADSVKKSSQAHKSSDRSARGKLILNINKERYDSRIGLNYRLRWDFKDFSGFNIFKLNPFTNWDITDNTKFDIYGFSMNPWRFLIKREKVKNFSPQKSDGKKEKNSAKSSGKYKNRFRISLYPLYNEFTEDLSKNLKKALLDESFSKFPGWKSTTKETKKLFIRDLLDIDGLWKIPGMKKPKQGLEYLEEE